MSKGASFLVALVAGALAFAAQAQAPGDLDAMFEAADRGDLAPIEAALARTNDADLRALLTARLADARFDSAADDDPVVARLAAGSADPVRRRAALSILTSAAFRDGRYGEAARFAGELQRSLTAAGETERATEVGRTHGLAGQLADRPAQTLGGEVVPGAVPLRYDRVGLPRIDFSVNGQVQEAVVDTGANLSVLSRETARRLGVEIIGTPTDVGNGVDSTVPVRIGIAGRIEIAGTVLRNVAFLIIDDEQLTFPLPGGYDIRAIIGLPVLRALGRVQVDHAGRFAVLAPATDAAGPPNLQASGNDLFVDVAVDGRPLPLHLDTGANQTTLSARYAVAFPEVLAGLETQTARLASAGGGRVAQRATWRQAPIELAGRRLELPELPIGQPGDGPEPRFFGTLGSNALRAFSSYTIDFTAMRLDLGPPVPPPAS